MKSLEYTAEKVVAEVKRAEQMWGTNFDSKNTLNDWAAYINIYLGQALKMGASPEEVRTNLRKVAGLALSALRWADLAWLLHHTQRLTGRANDGAGRVQVGPINSPLGTNVTLGGL